MSNSTTFWVSQMKVGNRDAAKELWERYHRRLLNLARKGLSRQTRTIADEDDIAQSAFASFFRAAEQGRFPKLDDRTDLWRLLLVITQRKISKRLRYENRKKRSRPPGLAPNVTAPPIDLEEIAGSDPTPEFCAIAIESFRNLLEQLNDATLQSVALMKMEGYSNEEIAHKLNCSLRTVERKLRRIRHEWASSVED